MKTQQYLSVKAQNVSPYTWEESSMEKTFNFSTNTLPSPPPGVGKFLAQMKNNCPINEYEDPDNTNLIKLIAQYENVPPEMITLTNSGDEAIDILAKAFINPGDVFITTPPTYEMYEIQCKINNGILLEVPLTRVFEVNEKEILRQSNNPKTKILFLVNPNNPTGSVIPELQLARIIKNAKCIVVVDEVYREFYGKSVVSLIKKFTNLVVLRSFSKFAGLAGARIGYLVADTSLTQIFTAIKFPMGISYLSARLAETVLTNDRKWIEKQVTQIVLQRQRMEAALKKLGLIVFPSQANFLLVRMGPRASDICIALKEKGILVRNRTDCIRISIRSPKENTVLIKALREIL